MARSPLFFTALNRVLIEDYFRAARGASGGGRRVLSAAKIASPDRGGEHRACGEAAIFSTIKVVGRHAECVSDD